MRAFLFPLILSLFGLWHTKANPLKIPNDSIRHITLPQHNVRAKWKHRPLSLEERQAYWRRIRDVKKTLPYAKYVAATIIETYEYMQTLPEREQAKHLRRVEQDLRQEMEPKMRNLTLQQGKILIKLVNRQCGSTSYELVKSVLGGWKAFWWNAFAHLLGANLKELYQPQRIEDDALTERIVQLIEAGML